jgi:hypothetical protein
LTRTSRGGRRRVAGIIDRDLCELPEGLPGPKYSSAYVDPSGENYWAVQWWIDTPDALDQQWLMDIERKKMGANELLDWDPIASAHGLMEEWQARSVRLGLADHALGCGDQRGAAVPAAVQPREDVGTEVGCEDPRAHDRPAEGRLGARAVVDAGGLAVRSDPSARQEQPRVPWPAQSMFLVREVTYWPGSGTTDDEVMAAWFHKLWRPVIMRRRPRTVQQAPDRPSWLRPDHGVSRRRHASHVR